MPNLVETVRGAAGFEQQTYTAVAEARAKVGQVRLDEGLLNNSEAFAKFQAAQDELGSAISRLLVAVENYPDLKASRNYLELQQELVNTEDRIQAARRFYNGNVRENNNLVQSFPWNLLASSFGFTAREYFEIGDTRERQAPSAAP